MLIKFKFIIADKKLKKNVIGRKFCDASCFFFFFIKYNVGPWVSPFYVRKKNRWNNNHA